MLLNKVVIFAQFARLCHIQNIKIICLRLSHELLDPQCASSLLGPSRASCDPRFRFTLLLFDSHLWGLLVRFAIPISSACLLLQLVFCALSLGFSWPCCKKFRQRCVCRWYFLSFPPVSLGLLQEVICLAMLLPLDSAGTSCRPLVAIGLLQ